MADDAAGAVRRTLRPSPTPRAEDHQTPETTPQQPAGATNTATPVSQDAGTGTGELSPEISEVAQALADLRARIHATAVLPPLSADNDVQAFLELPDCQACEGTGKDTLASPFDRPLAVHFAGEPVTIGDRRRQLCMWCGHVLLDTTRALNPDDDRLIAGWPVAALVRVEDGVAVRLPYTDGDPLPPGCCALPDDEGEPVCICTVESTPCPDCRDDEPVDPDDGYPVDLCGKHTGNASNRCLLAAHHAGECDDDPPTPGPGCYPPADGWDGASITDGPDEAQETRAAADWPAAPVNTHADEQEADRD